MIDTIEPWYFALRRLAFRNAGGPRTPDLPLSVPPGYDPPQPIPASENGYVALANLVSNWPAEGYVEPDLLHWSQRASADRKYAERALAPLRPLLRSAEAVLEMPRWQVPVGDRLEWPELKAFRRIGQAFLLKSVLDSRPSDRATAIELAQRLRRGEGPILHFLIGFVLERDLGGLFAGIEEDRRNAVHWDLARIVIPFAHRAGPWEPSLTVDVGDSADQRNAVAWALSGHPDPYDPQAAISEYLNLEEAMSAAPSAELFRLAQEFLAPWPPEMLVPGGFGGLVPIAALRRARPTLRQVPNAYGRLSLAQTLQVLGGTVAAIEKASK